MGSPVTVDDPATLKIGNTYFEIPNTSGAVSKEASKIYLEVNIINLGRFSIILKEKNDNNFPRSPGSVELSVNDEVAVVNNSSGEFGKNTLPKEIASYLRLHSSRLRPTTWDQDLALLKRLKLNVSECNRYFELQPPSAFTLARLSWFWEKHISGNQDILLALKHSSSRIRKGAVDYVQRRELNNPEIEKELLNLLSDKNSQVRFAATDAIAMMAADNVSLLPELRRILETSQDKSQRTLAASAITSVDRDFLKYFSSLGGTADADLRNVIRQALTAFLTHAIRSKNQINLDSFSNTEKKALSMLLILVHDTTDEWAKWRLVDDFYLYENVIVSDKYFEILNQLTLAKNWRYVERAVDRLTGLGQRPKNMSEIISNLKAIRFDFSGEADELRRLDGLISTLEKE